MANIYRAKILFIISAISKFRMLANSGTLKIEQVGYRTACQGDKPKQRASPLVAKPVIHLFSEQDDTSAPEASDEGLCG